MNDTLHFDAADLVATAGADVTLAALDDAFAAQGVWLALDPPGPRTASLGSALERGAGGPLAALFGPPRDQVIGLTFLAGNGRLVHTGGRVVKNVAGFDLAKLVVGGHGGFGRIVEANLRLRARPEADRTRAWLGSSAEIENAAARLMTRGSMLSSFETAGPGLAAELGFDPSWMLAARAMGTAAGVNEELDAAAAEIGGQCREVPAGVSVWAAWQARVGDWPVSARIGADPSAWRKAVALAARHGAGDFSATIPRGTVRARFAPGSADAIRALRMDAARSGWPVTLEQADDTTLHSVGIWGTMEDGPLRIGHRLRAALGPEGTQEIPLWA